RRAFLEICQRHDVQPAAACVEFGLSPPEVGAVALNTSKPQRVRECVELAHAQAPREFWHALRERRLIDANYVHVG
ncbi:MAG: hypothetical protein KDA61_10825, partial [Planctomycetales bacterium]|nr:hypothetical protein [Planctomycetales bacterium]